MLESDFQHPENLRDGSLLIDMKTYTWLGLAMVPTVELAGGQSCCELVHN